MTRIDELSIRTTFDDKTHEEGDETEIGTDGDPEGRERLIDETERQIDDSHSEGESVQFQNVSLSRLDYCDNATYTPTIQRLMARFGRPYNPFC